MHLRKATCAAIAILNMDKYIKDMAEQGVNVTYGGRYQNTGYFLRKYLGRPGGNAGCTGDADELGQQPAHLPLCRDAAERCRTGYEHQPK